MQQHLLPHPQQKSSTKRIMNHKNSLLQPQQFPIKQTSLCEILKSLLFYHPTNNKIVGYIFIALFPVGYPIYLLGCGQQKQLKKDLAQVRRTCDDLKQLHLDIFRKNE